MGAQEGSGLVPRLVVCGAARAVEFYRAALGAVEVGRVADGVELRIGGAAVVVCEGVAGSGRVGLHLDVPDCDAAVARAAAAGAAVRVPAADRGWGDRWGQVTDPFGHEWSFAHRLRPAA